MARSLFLFGLCNGQIHQHTTVIESSSGSTAVSEAYFARLLGLRFIAVIPRATAVIAREMARNGEEGSVVTIFCDSWERYGCTYDRDDWLAEQGIDVAPYDEFFRGLSARALSARVVTC